MKSYSKLDIHRVHRLLKEQQLKRWWVAECAGVHKTTLRRWLSGRIARVHDSRVKTLALVLQVPEGEITQKQACS